MEEAAKGAQFFGIAAGCKPALDKRHINLTFIEKSKVFDRTGCLDKFNRDVFFCEKPLVALGIGIIGRAASIF